MKSLKANIFLQKIIISYHQYDVQSSKRSRQAGAELSQAQAIRLDVDYNLFNTFNVDFIFFMLGNILSGYLQMSTPVLHMPPLYILRGVTIQFCYGGVIFLLLLLLSIPAQRRRGHSLIACNTAPPAKSKMAVSGPQNGRQGLERCLPLGFWAF